MLLKTWYALYLSHSISRGKTPRTYISENQSHNFHPDSFLAVNLLSADQIFTISKLSTQKSKSVSYIR